MNRQRRPRLSPLETIAMQVIWEHRQVTANDLRMQLAERWPMKESTARTILRRLEAKGYVTHVTQGRTYVYSSKLAPEKVTTEAVRGIVDRFCNGSVENLLVGMIDAEMITPEKLRRLAERIDEAEAAERLRDSSGEEVR